jgi:hypothetical protein
MSSAAVETTTTAKTKTSELQKKKKKTQPVSSTHLQTEYVIIPKNFNYLSIDVASKVTVVLVNCSHVLFKNCNLRNFYFFDYILYICSGVN